MSLSSFLTLLGCSKLHMMFHDSAKFEKFLKLAQNSIFWLLLNLYWVITVKNKYLMPIFNYSSNFLESWSIIWRSEHQMIFRNQFRDIELTLEHYMRTVWDSTRKIYVSSPNWGGVKKTFPPLGLKITHYHNFEGPYSLSYASSRFVSAFTWKKTLL